MKSQFNTITFKERFGMYRVGQKKFEIAFEALIEATRTGEMCKWDFNESTFSKIDWTKPVEASLDSLYLARMLQLRNEYDYLILFFSGGRDSLNILLTALKNKIFIDEIVMFYPFDAASSFNKEDISADNNFSEIFYSARPLLKKYENLIDSRTIIRDMDIGNNSIKSFLSDDWYEKTPPGVAFTVQNRTTSTLFDDKIMELAMQGKHVAVIHGIDKPKIRNIGGKYYAYFSDMCTNPCIRPKIADKITLYENHIFNELFYWTPYLPELAVKQAQVLTRAIKLDTTLKGLINHTQDVVTRSEIERITANYIYSDGEQPWQTLKQSPYLYKKVNEWFWKTAPEKARQNILYAMKHISKQINRDFFDSGNVANGKKPSLSQFYYVGNDYE